MNASNASKAIGAMRSPAFYSGWLRGLAVAGVVALHGCGSDTVSTNGGAVGGSGSSGSGGAPGQSGGAKGTTGGKASANPGNGAGGVAAGVGGMKSTGGAKASGGQMAASGGEPAASGGATGSPGSMRSAGCGKAGANTTPRNLQVTVAGTPRQYYLSFPQNYDANKAYALVFAFHGYGGDGASFRTYSGVEDNSAGEAIFAYPDGLNGVWDLKNDGNDNKLADAIFGAVKADYCIDENAVFAFGFSYGGWAATQIACGRPALIKGIVSVAGGGPMGNCTAGVPAMIVHGTNDPAEPVSSGKDTVTKFKQFNGCGNASTAVAPSPCVSYAGCSKPLLWCEHPGVHEIPEFAQTGAWPFFASLH